LRRLSHLRLEIRKRPPFKASHDALVQPKLLDWASPPPQVSRPYVAGPPICRFCTLTQWADMRTSRPQSPNALRKQVLQSGKRASRWGAKQKTQIFSRLRYAPGVGQSPKSHAREAARRGGTSAEKHKWSARGPGTGQGSAEFPAILGGKNAKPRPPLHRLPKAKPSDPQKKRREAAAPRAPPRSRPAQASSRTNPWEESPRRIAGKEVQNFLQKTPRAVPGATGFLRDGFVRAVQPKKPLAFTSEGGGGGDIKRKFKRSNPGKDTTEKTTIPSPLPCSPGWPTTWDL